mgnify:CR=1 FL=1
MQGLILAAGMGKRLKDLTKDNTKCMIRVNGITLIERMLRQLDELNQKFEAEKKKLKEKQQSKKLLKMH